MKNSLLALSTALVMGSTIQSAYATDHGPSQTFTQNDHIGSDWTFIQQIEGISISYSTITVGEARFLSVRFANTNSENADFIWSMTKNNEMLRVTEDEMAEVRIQLDANASQDYDGTYLIELSEEDQFSDFIVSIKPTKH